MKQSAKFGQRQLKLLLIIILLCVFSACQTNQEQLLTRPTVTIVSTKAQMISEYDDLVDNTVTPTLTPEVEFTIQPTGNITVKLSPTPSPIPTTEATATIEATPTLVPPSLKGPLIGFRASDGLDNDDTALVILDIGAASYKKIVTESIQYPFEVLWHGDGCELYLSNLIDLQGNITWQEPELDGNLIYPYDIKFTEFARLSPDTQWLAYEILYGERYYAGAEFTDIGIINFSSPTEPIFITNDGHAGLFDWSPDSQWLAYADADEHGIRQLFRVSPDGNTKEQLTFHTTPSGIGYIQWSPNGQYIAYAGYSFDENGIGWVDIVNLNDLTVNRARPDVLDFRGVAQDGIWWNLESSEVVFFGKGESESSSSGQIYWADAGTGTIIDSYHAQDTPSGRMGQVYAAGGINQMVIEGEGGYYLLDRATKELQFLIEYYKGGMIYDTESAPFDFPGEENCVYGGG